MTRWPEIQAELTDKIKELDAELRDMHDHLWLDTTGGTYAHLHLDEARIQLKYALLALENR